MEQIYLNLIPGGVSPVCYVSQYDVGRKIRLHLREGSDPYVLSGAETINATIRKATGEELIYDIANTSASYVDLVVNYDATDVIGESVCELVIYNSGVKLGSANFKMRIDPDVYSGDERLEIRTASGDPATFETNIVDNIPELKCNINAIQDGTPWIDSNIVNKEPYLFRKIAGTASRIGNSEFTTLIGGTVAFNQLVQNGNFADTSGWSFTNGTATASSNVCHFTFNATANRTELYCFIANTNSAHDYLFAYTIKSSKAVSVASVGGAISRTFGSLNANQEYVNMTIVKGGNNTLLDIYTDGSFENGDTIDYKNIVLIDLTTYFGTTIADYANTLESGTAGEGITWLKANGFDFSKYAPYNAGGLLSVKTSKKINRDADNNIIGEYPLDDIELRGILKLDGSNNLYYDGDTYESNGSVTRKYEYRAYASGDESLPDTITDGTYTVTKLVTPTFETADTFTNPMIVDGNGTEQFVDGRTVEMPVGHDTFYIPMN